MINPLPLMRASALPVKAVAMPLPCASFPLQGDLRGHSVQTGTIHPTFARASVANLSHNGKVYSAISGEPRYQADNIPLGVLIEGARTNSILQSRNFDTTWTASGTPILTQDQIGIDGVANTAWTLEDDDASGYEYRLQNAVVPDDSNIHTFYFYIKKDGDETRFPALFYGLTGGTEANEFCWINTKTGAITKSNPTGVGVTSFVTESAGAWWRVVASITNNSTGNTVLQHRIFPAAGTVLGTLSSAAVGSIVIDAAQLELNSAFPSSFIETTTVAVARAADILSYPLGSWFNTAEGTIALEVNVPYVGTADARIFILSDGTGNNRIDCFRASGTSQSIYVADGGVAQVNVSAATKWADGQTSKIAVTWAANDFAVYMDGSSIITDGAGSVPTGLTTLTVASYFNGNNPNYGNQKNIHYYASRLPNADLARLTA